MKTWGPYHAIVTRVHDGDTIYADVLLHKGRYHLPAASTGLDLGFDVQIRKDGVWLASQSIRLLGDNSAELATGDGKAALAYVQTIVKPGDAVTVLSTGWDKYGGRCDGKVTLADGRDLVTAMIAAGYAVVWNGKGAKPVPPQAAQAA